MSETERKSKKASDSAIEMTHVVLPQDANPAGNLHGGVILKHVDTAGGVVCKRHSSSNVVTASFDRMDFLRPAYVGDLLHFKASLNFVGTSSMEVGVRVEAENLYTGERRHTNTAYITYVALDRDGKPRPVPELILDSETAIRRNREASQRRAARFAAIKAERQEP